MKTNTIKEKKVMLEVLENLIDHLEYVERDATSSFEIVGYDTTEQLTDRKTGELLWLDEEKTQPKYRAKYDYVALKDEELTDEMRLKKDAIEKVRAALEKLI